MAKKIMKFIDAEGAVIGLHIASNGFGDEFVWNVHPFTWYGTCCITMGNKLISDEYGNSWTLGAFRDMLLDTRSWNLASIGKLN